MFERGFAGIHAGSAHGPRRSRAAKTGGGGRGFGAAGVGTGRARARSIVLRRAYSAEIRRKSRPETAWRRMKSGMDRAEVLQKFSGRSEEVKRKTSRGCAEAARKLSGSPTEAGRKQSGRWAEAGRKPNGTSTEAERKLSGRWADAGRKPSRNRDETARRFRQNSPTATGGFTVPTDLRRATVSPLAMDDGLTHQSIRSRRRPVEIPEVCHSDFF